MSFVFGMVDAISLIQNPAYVRSRPTFCIPKTAKLRSADCGLGFRSSGGATLRGLDTPCCGNSKSLANLLCAYAVPDARARTVRHRVEKTLSAT